MSAAETEVAVAPVAKKGAFPLRMVVIAGVAGLAAVTGIVMANRSNHQLPAAATVKAAPDVKSVAGSSDSPYYNGMVQDQNRARADAALKSDSSTIATIVGNDAHPVAPTASSSVTPTQMPPLPPPAPATVAQAQAPRAPVVEVPMSMTQQVDQLLAAWQPAHAITVNLAATPSASQATGAAGATTVDSAPVVASPQAPLLDAGSMIYGQMELALNSDSPGPVLATLLEGPLKGARVIGKFERKGDALVVHFEQLARPGKGSLPLDAYAIDPNASKADIASSVNHHTLAKYGGLLAAAFLQGYGQAVATAGSRTTILPGGTAVVSNALAPGKEAVAALGQVGQTLGRQMVKDASSIQPTVKFRAGEPIGILVMQPVLEKTR